MKSNKLFLFLFSLGLICLAFAGLSLFLGLNPSLFKPPVQYRIGSILSVKGDVTIGLIASSREAAVKDRFVYSKERVVLKGNSSATFKLSGESITISGPADLTLEVISPETKKIFINFSKFKEVSPKDEFKNLILTYKGWVIEPYFNSNDLNSSTLQKIQTHSISDEERPDDKPEEDDLLNELIASKRSLLKRCYENYLRKNPMATGKLVIEFTLQNTGKVSSSKIKDSSFFKDGAFRNCLQDVFRRIKTDPFEGPSILITYPIEFE